MQPGKKFKDKEREEILRVIAYLQKGYSQRAIEAMPDVHMSNSAIGELRLGHTHLDVVKPYLDPITGHIEVIG